MVASTSWAAATDGLFSDSASSSCLLESCKFRDTSAIYFNCAQGSICIIIIIININHYLVRKNGKGENADVIPPYLQVSIYTPRTVLHNGNRNKQVRSASWILALGGEVV